MANFKAQIEKGLTAHQHAVSAKQEIASVLEELDVQIAEATNGKVGIKVRSFLTLPEERSIFSGLAASIAASITSPTARHMGLAAYHKKHDDCPVEKLAVWEQANTGYPCTIRFDGQKRDCYDRQSLEKMLGELLATSETGRLVAQVAAYIGK